MELLSPWSVSVNRFCVHCHSDVVGARVSSAGWHRSGSELRELPGSGRLGAASRACAAERAVGLGYYAVGRRAASLSAVLSPNSDVWCGWVKLRVGGKSEDVEF